MNTLFQKLKGVWNGTSKQKILLGIAIVAIAGGAVLAGSLAFRGCGTHEPAVATIETNLQDARESIAGAQSTATAIGRGVKQGTRLNREAAFAAEGATTRLQNARATARQIERTSNELARLIREIENANKNKK